MRTTPGAVDLDATEEKAPLAEVILLSLGPLNFAVPREQVRAIHDRGLEKPLPRRELSDLLGFGPSRSDDRMVEVLHGGQARGLIVTGISGIRPLPIDRLRALPPLVRRNCPSKAVLGVLLLDGGEAESGSGALSWENMAIALDLHALLEECWPVEVEVRS